MSTAAGSPADLPLLAAPEAVRPGVGIVHLGLGAFARAFVAPHVAAAMAASGDDWGIVGVSLVNPTQRDLLAPQGFAYTAVELSAAGERPEVMTVVQDVLVAREDPAAVLDRMADPATRIVSITITEKGYCHEPSTGALNPAHPDIVHDLAHPGAPRSAPGFIVRALERRRAAGARPFTVLSCDNLPSNGRVVRGVVLDLARRMDPALADWIAAEGRFPSTMVDRIVPATTAADVARIADRTGVLDRAPVLHEAFRQFVVEDDFVDGARPDLTAAGVELTDDVAPFELMKLRCLNGTHSSLAYLGFLAGHETVAAAMADPPFAAFVRHLLRDEIIPGLTPPAGVNLAAYGDSLVERYRNPAIRHRTWQIAMDGSQKLPQRILGTVAENLSAGRPFGGLALAVAAWMTYVSGADLSGGEIDVRDPLAERLKAASASAAGPEGKVAALLALHAVFAPELAGDRAFSDAVAARYRRLHRLGARAAVAEFG